jgi:putative inorganic carbon (hco3(-)) transporter
MINLEERFTVNSLVSFNLSGLINILLILIGIVYFLINYKNPFKDRLSAIFIIFIIFCSLTLIYSDYLYGGIRYLARIICPFIFYLIILNEVKIEEDTTDLINCILFSAILPISIGIYQLMSGQGNTFTERLVRIYGSFEHPNAYSYFLVFLFCISYTILLTSKTRWKIYLLFLLNIIIMLLIVQTYCRISWVAFMVVFFLLSYRYRKRKLIIILIIIAIILCFVLSYSVFERLTSTFNEITTGGKIAGADSGTGNSMVWRINAWIYLLKQIPKSPIIGYGLGAVISAMNEFYGIYIHPHNAYIGILYDTGIIGFSLFIMIIIILLIQAKTLISNIKEENNLFNYISIYLASLISFFIIATTDNIFENPSVSIYFWVFFAVGSSIYNSFRKNKKLKTNKNE